jgi:pimeloyl-ACP methyl ester carboxylesterase
VGIVDFLAYLKLQYAGFNFHRLPLSRFLTLFPFRPIILTASYRSPAKHLTYWHRPHTSATRLPVLFIHGIGIGLYPYTSFLADINTHVNDNAEHVDGQIGILAIEIMPISFRISHPALGKDNMCAELHQILIAQNYSRFVLISHSYGSVISTHILSNPSLRPLVSSALFIDPVSFLLHNPDVAYNFTVRKPRRANEWQLWYFASKDPGVAHALGRRFFWSENVLWKEDAEDLIREGKQVTVSLGGRDLIVNTAAVGRYLIGHATANGARKRCTRTCPKCKQDAWKGGEWIGKGLEVLWFDKLDHSQVFDKKATRARLVKAVREYCETAPPARGESL